MRKLHRIKGFVRAYTVKGVRYSYGELAIKFPNRAKQIRDKTREIAKEMLGINRILSKAVYVPTSHLNKHKCEDDKTLWFTYKDSTRSGIWFKVKRDMSGGGTLLLVFIK